MKLKQLFAAALLLCSIGAWADDVFKDVTSTYLTNADFEGEYTVYSNPSSDRAIYQPNGWTVSYTSGDPNDMTALNSTCLCWSNFSGKAQLATGGNKTYWVRMRWGTGAVLELSQTVTLPAGSYKLTAAYYKNGSGGDGYILVNSTTKNTNVNEDVWKSLSIDFTSDGATATKIGCKATHTNTYEKFLAFDNFVLEWNLTEALASLIASATEAYNEDTSNTNLKAAIDAANDVKDSQDADVLETAYNNLKTVAALAVNRKAWSDAKSAAEAAVANTDYANVTGSELTALNTEIGKAEPSDAEGYETAKNALIAATSAFTAAKDSYDAYATAKAAATDVNEADVLAVVIAGNTAATAADALAASVILPKAQTNKDATYAAPVVTNFVVNGTFDSNVNGWSRTGGFQNNNIASNQSGAFTGNFYENWTPAANVAANKMYQVINNIPNGTYRLDICAFVNNLADPNESQYVFANSDKTYLTTGDPTAYEVWTVVTNNQVEVGLEQTTATANWMGIDNVSLRYYGAGDVIAAAQNAAHKLTWEESKAAAEAAIANGDYANVTGSEKTALQTEIAKAEPTSAAGYDEAAAALNTATAAFTAAKANYDALVTEIAYAKTIGVTTADDYAATSESTDASVVTSAQALKVMEYSTINAAYPNDVTSLIGTWTAGNYGTTSGQGYIGDETYFDKWNGSAMDLTSTKTVKLPAGKYVVRVAGRGVSTTTMNLSVKVGDADALSTPFLMTGDTGKGIDTNGATNFSEEGTYSNNNVGRGWQYRYVTFTTTTSENVVITISGHLNSGTWQSFYAPVLLCNDETYADIYAGAAEYTALNNAIAAAEAKTLGFADGEYAPYANVVALEALAAAKAIDQTAQNMKAVVEAATTALTGATWTANDGDVEIIYNGMFETAASGQNYPEGWTRTNSWGQMRTIAGDEEQFATAYYNQPGSLQYGNQGVYTMPLKANTPYNLHFYYRSHENNSNKGVTVSVLNENNEGMAPATFMENGNTQEWAEASASFTTGAAGNYVLTLANVGNTWMTCINLTNLHSIDPTFTATEDFNDVDGPTTGHDRMYIETVNITRKVKDGFNTVCLPFDVTAEGVTRAFGANAKVYTYSETSTDPDDVTINFNLKDGNTISANVPVLIGDATTSEAQTFSAVMFKSYTGDYPVVAGTNFDFAGVYAPMTVAEGDYFIGGGKLYKSVAGTTTTIKAFRAYIDNKSNNSGVEVKMYIDGITTDINAIDNEQMSMDNEAIYTIAGQRVQKAQKGLYIVNGKKVAVR